MKTILGLFACLLLLQAPSASALAAEPDLVAAVGMAGRQRMLSQRIVKAYAQTGLAVMPEASRAQLEDAVAVFDKQLAALKAMATDDVLRQAVTELENRWLPMRSIASGPVDRLNVERLAALDADLLAAADKVTLLLRARVETPLANVVNIAGRQRMLSQRVAKIYMLKAWGLSSPRFDEDMQQSIAEFTGSLAALREAGVNTSEIRRELDSVAVQWEWFTTALELEGAFSYTLVIADSSESILRSMENVTALYERAAR